MKKFLKKIFRLALPVMFLVCLVMYIDFFKIFGFQDYYATQKVGLNREMVTTTTFNNFRAKEKFDSFIFGSSRSQAFKCENWKPYLDTIAKPFHFDASGDGVWGISKKVQYIDELGDSIKNALVVIDREGLGITYPRSGHLFVSMPCVSKLSKVDYYSNFLRASLNPKFLIAYSDYSLFGTYRGYMGHLIRNSKYENLTNKRNCDIWYGYDKEIKVDSLGYYNSLIEKEVFYPRPKPDFVKCPVTSEEIVLLKNIKRIFSKHKTKYKIVISPIYDQIPMEKEQLELLEEIFGKQNIYNFSGKNEFTNAISNYYETSHYRPHVANKIFDFIYSGY